MKVQNTASWMLIATATVIALYFGKNIIIPFIIALLIWFVVKKMRNLIDKVSFVKKYVPNWLKTSLAALFVINIILFVGSILTANIENLTASWDNYASNVELIAIKLNEVLKIDVQEELVQFMNSVDVGSYLQSFFNSISDTLSNMVIIVFYVVFLVIEETLFQHKIKLMFRETEKYERVTGVLQKIDKLMSKYISLKSLVSLLTTTLSYFILLAVGIDSPLFWAFLIFILNFIPSVGPIIATVLPALFSLLQFGEFVPFLIILFGVGTVSTIVGSVVEPKLLGNTLNISPLVAVISLSVWGSLWGIIGMLLSVPITVAMIIVFSQFAQTRSIAILLSEKGRL